MKVVFQYDASLKLAARLSELSTDGIAITPCPDQDMDRFLELMADADAIFHVLNPITSDIIARSPKLKLIQKIGVGVNTIDLDAARARGIKVANMLETNTRAVAETTLMLNVCRAATLAYIWRGDPAGCRMVLDAALFDSIGELGGRTVGLIGYGAQMLTPMLFAMGAGAIYTSRQKKGGASAEWRALSDLLRESDIVSLHLPLTESTAGIIDQEAIATMKDGAILINTARGGLVEEDALITALENGKLRAAGLDVFQTDQWIQLIRCFCSTMSPFSLISHG